MAQVPLNGPTAESTQENIKTIKKTEKAYLSGLTIEDTMDLGKMENSMDLGHIERQI